MRNFGWHAVGRVATCLVVVRAARMKAGRIAGHVSDVDIFRSRLFLAHAYHESGAVVGRWAQKVATAVHAPMHPRLRCVQTRRFN